MLVDRAGQRTIPQVTFIDSAQAAYGCKEPDDIMADSTSVLVAEV